MNSRTTKRRIYARYRLRGKTIWLTAEERAWLNITPIGREFGSKNYERLEILDAFTFGRIDAQEAMRLLGIDQAALIAMVETDGLKDVKDLKGMFGKVKKTVSIDDMNPLKVKP